MINIPTKQVDFLVHEFDCSSRTSSVVSIANSLLEKGVQVQLIIMGEKAPPPFPLHKDIGLKFLGIRNGHSFWHKTLYMLRAYFILSTYLAKTRSRYLFAWGTGLVVLAEIIRISLLLRYKLIGVSDVCVSGKLKKSNIFLRKFLNIIYKSVLDLPDYIIAHTPEMATELRDAYKIPSTKITSIYPMVREDLFRNRKAKKPEGKVLFIGGFNKQKNPFAAVEIFSKLEGQAAILKVIGSGELEFKLIEKTSELGLERRVLFVGNPADIKSFLQDADVLICTSQYENFGVVAAEAIASGVPVVAFNCKSGPSEIIIDGVNGYLVAPGDNEAFASKLSQALTNEWDYKRIAETAKKFHKDALMEKYLEVIRITFGC